MRNRVNITVPKGGIQDSEGRQLLEPRLCDDPKCGRWHDPAEGGSGVFFDAADMGPSEWWLVDSLVRQHGFLDLDGSRRGIRQIIDKVESTYHVEFVPDRSVDTVGVRYVATPPLGGV